MDTSEKIICPVITVWVLFIANLFFYYLKMLVAIISIFVGGGKGFLEASYEKFEFFSLLINFLIELTASILVSLSFEKKKQRLYLIGLIMSLIFDIYMTIFFIISFMREYKNIINYYTEYYFNSSIYREMIATSIFTNLFQMLMQWSQFGVLMIYLSKVKQSFNQSDLSPGLVDIPIN